MRLLIVAVTGSPHTHRWLSQLADTGWDIHLFPSVDNSLHSSDFKGITIHHSFYEIDAWRRSESRVIALPVPFRDAGSFARRVLEKKAPDYRALQLAATIKLLRPDIVHSMELQRAGYLVDRARSFLGGRIPKWIATNYGCDLHLFGRLDEHRPRLRSVLEHCDFYSCECQRDVGLAIQHGLRGQVLPVMPNTGGFDLEVIQPIRSAVVPSRRKRILVKGYQHIAGRALVAFAALRRISHLLEGFEVAVFGWDEVVAASATMFSQDTGVKTVLLPRCHHSTMLQHHAQARVFVGLSISDAISTSMLEAMAMGAFPVQSGTACADEWIVDGLTGFMVEPEDPEAVAEAIRRAITDDRLVDQAFEANWNVCTSRLDSQRLRHQAIEFYSLVQQGSSGHQVN